jgi:serine/threonine-protein phosphatase 4 regulatory subunit 1
MLVNDFYNKLYILTNILFFNSLPLSRFARTKEVIFPIVEQLVRDEETLLRQHLAEQMTGLSEVCVKHSRQLQAAAAAAALTAVENGNNGMSQIPSNGSAATAQQSSLHTSVVLDEGRKALFDLVLPIIGQLLSDPIAEVRVSAGVSLVAAAGLMRIEDLGPRVLTLVLQLAHNDEQEDIRMTAAVLLNELAETFGPDLCIQFVASEVVCLAEDPLFRVRKAAALNLDAICRTAGPVNAAKKLLPAFLKLASDDIWGVRKACAESVGAMSRCLDPVVRVSELMPLYERLLNDASKWVRNAALQHLGPFLATLPGPKISASFLAHYVRMGLPLDAPSHGSPVSLSSSSSTASLFSSASAATLATLARIGADPADAELAVYCAFSFPAVALTFGKQRWSELRHLFISLSRDVQCKVRRPLAFSIHELARILGPDIAEADLVPAFDIFLKDVNEVKFGVIRNLSQFLKALSANATRESYLPVLDELLRASQPHNWRFRKSLASQLTSFCSLFSAHATHEIVTPFALSLLADPVSEVREEAINGIPALLNRLGDADAGHQMELISALQRLGLASNYKDRLLFVRICGEIAKGCDVNLFRRHFMTEVLSLANDTVRNVRRYLAILISPYTTALLRESSAVVTSMPVTIDSILQSKLSTTTLLQTDQCHQNETQVDAKNDLILGVSHIQPSSSAAITSANSAESLPPPPPPPLPSPHIRINQSAATQSIDISVSSIDTSIKMLSLETTEKHSLESEAIKHLDEEEIFPIWAREDSAGLLKQALITLACDIDAEVVRALDSVWVEKHRSQPLPDVLMYVRNHALPIITSKSEDMSEIIETVESVSPDERQNVFIKKENDLGMAEEAVEEL